VDTPRDGNYTIDLEFTAPGYAQIMQKRLMVFRPSILEPVDPLPFSDPKRAYPAVINARTWRDTVTVVLPEGFEVDEIPAPAKLETAFGTYESKSVVEEGVLTFTRTLELKSAVVAVEDYARLREFTGKVGGADSASVVLAKK
jgi:hypothetical protein